MQRWEYRVVSLRDGQYTAALNEYGQEGWELVDVVAQEPASPASASEGGGLPIPRPVGRLEDAAATIGKIGGGDASAEATAPSTLLWVLRRPLDDDD